MSGIDRERLLAALARKGLSPRKASLDAGLGESFVRDVLDGRSKSPRVDRLQKLASTLGVDLPYLTGTSDAPGEPTELPPRRLQELTIRGRVQAGTWTSVDHGVQEPYGVEVLPTDPQFPHARQWLDIVVGDSMDKARIFDGDLIRVVDAADIGYAPRPGDIVVVERTSADGSMVERSVKQVQVGRGGVVTLHPRSTNPAHQSPLQLSLPQNPEEDGFSRDYEVCITGLVRQAIRQFR